MELKRCERELDAVTAAGVQAMVRKLCGRCLCESGEQCPLFRYAPAEAVTPRTEWDRVVLDPQPPLAATA